MTMLSIDNRIAYNQKIGKVTPLINYQYLLINLIIIK